MKISIPKKGRAFTAAVALEKSKVSVHHLRKKIKQTELALVSHQFAGMEPDVGPAVLRTKERSSLNLLNAAPHLLQLLFVPR